MRLLALALLVASFGANAHTDGLADFSSAQIEYAHCSAKIVANNDREASARQLVNTNKFKLLTVDSGKVREFRRFYKQHVRPVCGSARKIGLSDNKAIDLARSYYSTH